MKQTIYGIVLYVILLIPPILALLESIMIIHMLVQLPLLLVAGWLIGKGIIKKYNNFFKKWNGNGVAGITLVVLITTYWMLPRAMDESLSVWYVEVFKYISLPITGLIFRSSWEKLQLVGKSFIFMNYISMFALMAWLYIDSPIQVCNNYLETEQRMLGWGFLVITAAMILYIIQIAFIDHSEER